MEEDKRPTWDQIRAMLKTYGVIEQNHYPMKHDELNMDFPTLVLLMREAYDMGLYTHTDKEEMLISAIRATLRTPGRLSMGYDGRHLEEVMNQLDLDYEELT